jgi:hypothetical protein
MTQSFASTNDAYFVSSRGTPNIFFDAVQEPPLVYLNKQVLFAKNDDKRLYYDDNKLAYDSEVLEKPTGSTKDNTIARWDGDDSKKLKDSNVKLTGIDYPGWVPGDVFSSGTIDFINDSSNANLTHVDHWYYNTIVGTKAKDQFAKVNFGNNVALATTAFDNYKDTNNVYNNVAIGANCFNNYSGHETGTIERNVVIGDSACSINFQAAQGNTILGSFCCSNLSRGDNNVIIGNQAVQFATGAVDTIDRNVIIGQSAAAAFVTGTDNIILGNGAGIALNTANSNWNIILGNPGVAGDSATMRLGRTGFQTSTFIAGIYDKVPSVGSKVVLVDPNGLMATTETEIPPYEEASVELINSTTPSTRTFGEITFNYVRVGKAVTCMIKSSTGDVNVAGDTVVYSGAIPSSFRPRRTCEMNVSLINNNVYDTGMISTVRFSTTGTITFIRDRDGSPSDFTGTCGFDRDLTNSWITI